MVYTETLKSPRLFRRKALNSIQGKEATFWLWHVRSCQQKLILWRRNEVANRVWLMPVVLTVSKWSSQFLGSSRWPAILGQLAWAWKRRSMQNIIIVRRSSLVYLAEAMVGTGPHASLGVRSLIWRSPQKHLDYCTRLSVAGRFCESESRVPWLQSSLTKLLQMGWLTRWVWRN